MNALNVGQTARKCIMKILSEPCCNASRVAMIGIAPSFTLGGSELETGKVQDVWFVLFVLFSQFAPGDRG